MVLEKRKNKSSVLGSQYKPENLEVNHMAQWNLFDVVISIILKFPTVLKFPADAL